jgi:hypothetical protein
VDVFEEGPTLRDCFEDLNDEPFDEQRLVDDGVTDRSRRIEHRLRGIETREMDSLSICG